MKKIVKWEPSALADSALSNNGQQVADDKAKQAKTIKAAIAAQLQHRESKIRFKAL